MDFFAIPQWAVSRVDTAVLKVTADEYFKVVFNGAMLKNYEVGVYYYTRFLSYNVKGLLRVTSESGVYQENLLEVYVMTEVPEYIEGLLYRVDFTFT